MYQLLGDRNRGLAYERVKFLADLLKSRTSKVKNRAQFPGLPPELSEAVHTLIFAAPNLEVEELHELRFNLMWRYGITEPSAEAVSGDVAELLSAVGGGGADPGELLVIAELKRMADGAGIPFDERADLRHPKVVPFPAGGGGAGGGGFGGGAPGGVAVQQGLVSLGAAPAVFKNADGSVTTVAVVPGGVGGGPLGGVVFYPDQGGGLGVPPPAPPPAGGR